MSKIETRNLSYTQGNFTIKDLSIAFPEGQITGIVGPNGSGKSTLLKLVSRLLHKESGEIILNDKDIASYKRKELAKQLAMLLQLKEAMPNFTVKELVAYGRIPYKKTMSGKSNHEDEIIDWAIDVTGLTHLSARLVYSLSGGEQQRVRIAMALAQKTDVLLLDEPTTYLDIGHQMELMGLLKKINHDYGITIIMVLHELQYAAAYCHNMIVMKNGDVYLSGSPQDLLTASLLRDVYKVEAKIIFDGDYPLIIPNQI
ncbi:ABC transporter ATP-binding protein [Cytobacillus purgationiresistens]|uniref:ABC-type cobalamin/Fe3+-siderophores transport system ATPase subunit n=1 Tax=Cytobacillus purgationiresistens TaxID=863449 RepID=A0ABU0AR55_9BACI|nr:ABC transporter ATP-binding protein [Cytobacillus purgationiresistens]MDQ0272525.1 ABC-type cobalamin/Fe3+-siderophores transport system ATPase subunit [Cytobacillus purgationiresistens]